MSPHNHMNSVLALFVEKLPAILDALELSEVRMTEERYAEAEQITRTLLGPIKHLLGYHSTVYVECEAKMALSQSYTGKHSESNWRFDKVIRTSTIFTTSAKGVENWTVLGFRLQYAASLLRQLGAIGSYKANARNVLRIMRRVFGEHHGTTMACIAQLAASISLIVGVHEYIETTITTRVFCGMSNLATSLSQHAQFAEAESIYTTLLGAREIVLGTLHSQTVETRRNMTACKVARHTQVARRKRRVQNESVRRSSLSRRHGMCSVSLHQSRSDKLHQSRIAEMMTRRRVVATRTSVTTKAPTKGPP